MTPTIRRTIAVAVALATLAACSSGSDAESTTTTASPSTTTTTTTPPTTTTVARTTTTSSSSSTSTTVPDVLRMPLTGEPVDSADEIPVRPALAVKIDNHPKARPQAGLNEADIVFEENVEKLTRFAAVYHSQSADPVGPIRSGRTQDVDILSALHSPLFGWSGGNRGVTAAINDSDLVSLNPSTAPGFYRRSGRNGAPHNLFSSTDALWLSAPADFTVPDPIFPYLGAGDQVTGQTATIVKIPMDGVNVEWEYDAASGQYLRSQNGTAHEDELSGRVSTDNLVVMGVEYGRSSADPASPEAKTLGSGPVFVFSHGVMRQGVWIHLDRLDPFGFVALDDSTIGLQPGRTFVELAYNAENFVTWQA